MGYKQDLIAALGEFVGTFLFLFLGEGGAKTASYTRYVNNSVPDERPTSLGSETIVFVSLSFGLSLTVTAWMFYRISGSLFNPAITLSLYLIGAVPWLRAILLVLAQIAGGISAAAMVKWLTPFHGTASVTKLEKGVSIPQGLFLEALLTSALVFSVLMLAAEKHKATYLAPIGIGFTLFVCHLFGVLWTGASLNPARAFGPSVIEGVWPSYHWLYWVGPLIGSLIAVFFYIVLKSLDYTQVVLGQDSDHSDGVLSAVPTRLVRKVTNGRKIFVMRRSENGAPVMVEAEAKDLEAGVASSLTVDAHGHRSTSELTLHGLNGNADGIAEAVQKGEAVVVELAPAEGCCVAEGQGTGDLVAPTMAAEGQNAGGMLAPGTVSEGLAGNSFIQKALQA